MLTGNSHWTWSAAHTGTEGILIMHLCPGGLILINEVLSFLIDRWFHRKRPRKAPSPEFFFVFSVFCSIIWLRQPPAALTFSFRVAVLENVQVRLSSSLVTLPFPPRVSCHFSTHFSIRLWYTPQICWTISDSSLLSCLPTSLLFSSDSSFYFRYSPLSFSPAIYSSALLCFPPT